MGLLRFLSRRRPGKGVRLENGPDHLKPPKGHVDCKVQLLDGTDMTVFVPKKALAQELYDQVYYSLDLMEKDYFGLQFSDTHQVKHWLDPTKTIKKQMKIGPPYTLRFRVKFYSLEPQNLREEYTRYQFYLQLKQDILTGRLECPFDVAVELSAYILQSDLGDYDPEVHTPEFISEYRFVPEEVQTEEMEVAILDAYKKLKGQTPAQVELNFLRKVKWLEKYGQDLHIAYGRDGNEYQLGLNPHGILVVEGNTKIGHFFWHKTEKIHFNKKKLTFVVLEDDEQGRANEHTFPFWMRNKKAAKHLWKCAVEHHTFFRLSGPPKEPSVGNKLFRMNSRFRYSGKTESQTAHEIRPRKSAPQFERRPSQRYSRRSSIRRPPLASNLHGGNPEAVSPPTVPASSSGTTEILEFKTLSPAPVAASAVPVSPKGQQPISYVRQPSMSSSSCEVLATSYFMMPTDIPPPVPPRLGETKRSPSQSDLASREEPPKAPRTPVQPVSFFPESTDIIKSPLSPTKPTRVLQNPPPVQVVTERPVPFEIPSSKSSLLKSISEDRPADVQRRPLPEPTPITPLTPAASSNLFSYIVPPREIIGFKLNNSDQGRPKDSAPKELVSILKKDVQQPSDSYNTINHSSKLANGLRDASNDRGTNDSGRASPPSSPSVSPSRTSSALSAVSKTESNRLSIEICDTMPLLHDSDAEHEEPLPTMLVVAQSDAVTISDNEKGKEAIPNEIIEITEEELPVACCYDRNALLEITDHDKQPLIEFACEPSITNSVSRSGSGASTGSAGMDKYNLPTSASNLLFSQIKPWMLPETKPYIAPQSSTMQPRRVITTEL